ncbi:MAG TPA: MerR family transcriptional regulator [Thermoanaerobaculia bacterium]|nr:MerR family transcriptional regulator [Thermoanaerobaculia bacterium]
MAPKGKGDAPPPGRAHETPPRDGYVFIGVIARRFGVHPQTLRLYEREGLIRPARSSGNTRLYDVETVERLEIILTLTRELGVNLAGVEVILDLKSRLARMEGEVGRLMEAIRAVAKDHAARGGAAKDDRALAVRPRGAIVLKYE